MRFNVSRLVLIGAALLAVSTLEMRSVWADEKKAGGIVPSGSTSGTVTTNSEAFKPKQNGLKQLEQDLFRPFETIAPKGSLEGAFAPPAPEPRAPTPDIQSKRVKELFEHRRDWVFETPEEILATPSTKKEKDGLDKERDSDNLKLSPVERFYERLYSKDKKDSTRKGNKREDVYDSLKPASPYDYTEADDDSDVPLGIRETQREMRKLLAPKERGGDSADPSRNAFSDVFGLGRTAPSAQEIELQRSQIDRYKELVGLPVMPRSETDPLKEFRQLIGSSPKPVGSLPKDSLGSLPQQNLFGAQSRSGGSGMMSLLPEGAKVHETPSLAPVLPKIEPPKSLPPPVTFNAPRRAF
jgi:hypothetical protein